MNIKPYTLEQILDLWSKDSPVDRTDLGASASTCNSLHSKYINILSQERILLNKTKSELDVLTKFKHEYYLGTISEEDRKARGWPIFGLKVIRDDLKLYIEADKDIVELKSKLAMRVEKVDTLKSILSMIHYRSNNINVILNDEKFKAGIG